MPNRPHGSRVASYLAVAVAGILVGAGGFAFAASSSGVIHACANKKTGALRLSNSCKKKTERAAVWNVQGPQGLPGKNGTNGTNGTNGINGTNGANGATAVVIREKSLSAVSTVQVQCNSGERAVGGGGFSSAGNLIVSVPINSVGGTNPGNTPTGWQATFSATGNVTATVVCASP